MKRDFLRLLKELEEEELRAELTSLYDRFPAVREYYKMELSPNTKALLDKYKKEIRKSFFPSRGRRIGKRGRSASKKVIKNFSLISIHARDVVELHFYRTQVMLEAAHHFKVTGDGFLDSVVRSFAQSCELAQREVLLDSFRDHAAELVEAATHLEYHTWNRMRQLFGEYW